MGISDREPVWRKAEDAIDDTGFNLRNKPSDALGLLPRYKNRNIGGGIGVGIVQAGVAKILDDTVGVPFGSETEIVGIEPADGGYIYTVNIDAPTENMAQARAFLESGTGFTSILTDLLKVENTEVLKTRVLRDTYQVEVLIED